MLKCLKSINQSLVGKTIVPCCSTEIFHHGSIIIALDAATRLRPTSTRLEAAYHILKHLLKSLTSPTFHGHQHNPNTGFVVERFKGFVPALYALFSMILFDQLTFEACLARHTYHTIFPTLDIAHMCKDLKPVRKGLGLHNLYHDSLTCPRTAYR